MMPADATGRYSRQLRTSWSARSTTSKPDTSVSASSTRREKKSLLSGDVIVVTSSARSGPPVPGPGCLTPTFPEGRLPGNHVARDVHQRRLVGEGVGSQEHQ